MACNQAKSNVKDILRQTPEPKGQGEVFGVRGKRPQGIKKQPVLRKSPRLQAIRQSYKQSLSTTNHIQEVQASLSPPASNTPEGRKGKVKKLDISLLQFESSLLPSDHKSRLQAATLR
ncbi:MAG: hypothetical protein Q9207_006041 [Kuettlingeria erythrocarpa]